MSKTTEHSQAEKIILLFASQDKKKQFEINRAFTNKRIQSSLN